MVWILIEGATLFLAAFDLPDWVLRGLIIVAVIGLPVAIILAWVYDVTDSGIEVQADPTDTVISREHWNRRCKSAIESAPFMTGYRRDAALRLAGTMSSPSGVGVLCQKSVQVVGKRLFVTLTECSGSAAHFHATGPHRVHKITHVESCAYVFASVHFAARTQRMATLGDDFRRQRNVAGDNKVAGVQSFNDFIVRDIESLGYLQRVDIG